MGKVEQRTSNSSDDSEDEADENMKCRPAWRYITAVLAFFAMVNSYTIRNHLSLTMVAMVNSSSSTDQADSCPTNDSTTSSEDKPGPFNWDSEMQGLIFGGFYWGYIIPQIWGGRMAEKYGPNKIICLGGFLATLATAIGPWAADVNVWFFFATRVACGLGLAVYTPCIHALIAKWAPPNERSRFAAFVYSGNQVGTIISTPVAGVLCTNAPNGGWPWPFYTFAIISGVWLVLWFFFVYDSPAQHRWISKREKDMIERKLSTTVNAKKRKPLPLKDLMKSKPFWGIMGAHFGHNWGFYTLLTQIPTYMSDILRYDLEQNGAMSAVPYIVLMLFGYCCSITADYLINSKKMSTTNVRKTSQTIAFVGSAVFLLIITFLTCQTNTIYSMLVLAVGADGGSYSGFQINAVDLSPNFAGTIQGFTNTLGCIPGIVSPYITGVVTKYENTQARWNIIFYITFGVLIVSAIQYLILGSGELQYWNSIDDDDDEDKAKSDEAPNSTIYAIENDLADEKY